MLTVATTRLTSVADIELRLGFEQLYRRGFPGLVGVATALVGDIEEAQDLVQDTMVKAFVRWKTVSRLAVPLAWCHRVLTNSCRSWWRRRNTEQRYRHMLVRRSTALVGGPTPEIVAFWAATRMLPSRPRL